MIKLRAFFKKTKQFCRRVWETTKPARRWIAKVARKGVKVVAAELARVTVREVLAGI